MPEIKKAINPKKGCEQNNDDNNNNKKDTQCNILKSNKFPIRESRESALSTPLDDAEDVALSI